MKYVLIVLLILLVALFVFLLSQDTREADKAEDEKRKKDQAERAGKKAINLAKKQCFDAYRKQLTDERDLGLIKAAISENGGFHYISELFAFRAETESHRLMSYEYRKQLAERVLNPLNAAVSAQCPYKDGKYALPRDYDVFLTPEEYYDQQLSYRGTSVIYQTDLEFWQERLDITLKKIRKFSEDKGNRFWLELWDVLLPFFEELQVEYRLAIDGAASHEAALLLTKDITDRIEQELFRKGITVMRYFSATPHEREKYFRYDRNGTDRPAIIREADGICFEKGTCAVEKNV